MIRILAQAPEIVNSFEHGNDRLCAAFHFCRDHCVKLAGGLRNPNAVRQPRLARCRQQEATITEDPPEIEELEQTASWRLRLVDANPADTASTAAAHRLEALADDLRRNDYTAQWTELRSIGNWLAESDAISDYAELAADYRARIGISEHPTDGAAYLRALLAIARSLV